MRIVRLQAEGFKRLVAVDISPDGDLVALGGDNGEGKSSVLDAIFAALGGAAAAPIKPVRTGEEYAIIKLDLGDLKVTRYFSDDGTDKLRVENAEGAVFTSAQTMLDKLVGKIAFDPLAFAYMEPKTQAAELRRLVPLAVDLDELAKADKADYAERRDVNRDANALKARIEGIVVPEGELGERPDVQAIATALANAAEVNSGIERDRGAREREESEWRAAERFEDERETRAEQARQEAANLRARADELDEHAKTLGAERAQLKADREAALKRMSELPALPPLVDTAKLNDDLAAANRLAEVFRRRDERAKLREEFEALKSKSEGLTNAMGAREAARAKALSEAKMPVPGLTLGKVREEDDELVVMFEGEPFSQTSTAAQLRVSARIAIAMNPKLRVMVAKQGAFLDGKGLAMLREIATEHDFQIWLETVGDREGVGIIMEGGKVRGAADPEPIPAPKRRKAKGEGGEPTTAADENSRIVSPGDEFDGSGIEPGARKADEPPARRKPQAMREFTTPKPQGGLFGERE